jgi:hypothetical protein
MIKTIGFISGLLPMSVASSAFATTVKQEPPMQLSRYLSVLNLSNRRIRTRTYGGVGGEES